MHRKLINRGATEFMCLTCLANYLKCSEELLLQKKEQFRAAGCVLFAKSNGSTGSK